MSVPNLPKIVLSPQTPVSLAEVLARIQVKLPQVNVPTVPPAAEPPQNSPRGEPILSIALSSAPTAIQCTEVTNTDHLMEPSNKRTRPTPSTEPDNSRATVYGYLYTPTEEGERWRESISGRYPKLNKALTTVRRVLLSSLARFLLLDTNPPRGSVVPAETHAEWSECVGTPHAEFLGDLS